MNIGLVVGKSSRSKVQIKVCCRFWNDYPCQRDFVYLRVWLGFILSVISKIQNFSTLNTVQWKLWLDKKFGLVVHRPFEDGEMPTSQSTPPRNTISDPPPPVKILTLRSCSLSPPNNTETHCLTKAKNNTNRMAYPFLLSNYLLATRTSWQNTKNK